MNLHIKYQPVLSAVALAIALLPYTPAHADSLNLTQEETLSPPLSFNECVEIALKQNFDLISSRAQIDQAQSGLDQAQANRMPKLTASINAMGSNDAMNAFGMKLSQRTATFNDFGANQFDPNNLNVAPTSLNYPGFVTNVNTRLEVQIPVYTGGMISNGIKQAQAYIKAARNGDIAARQQVIFHVLQAYQGVHTARAYLVVSKQAEAAADSQVNMMEKLVKGGVIVKSDLLSGQVRLQDIRIQRMQAENAVSNALDQLHLLLGMPLTAPLNVGASVDIKPTTMTTEALRQTAIANNPGVNALRQQVEASAANIGMAKAAYKPQVGLMLRQDWNDPTLGFSANSYTVGGTVSWTAFDGGVTSAGVARARAAQTAITAKLAQAEAGVAYQVEDARRKASEAEQRLSARHLGEEQATEAASLVNKRYINGVATITEQLAAQAQLDKARADVVAAEYDVAIQRANLKLVLGQLEAEQL
ncbi:TolC family protein [Sulfuriferula nivalis]|uniref:Membrane protein n=1 Tax=Sulfuriferula nivalis TaxID=2675298 RepID=A0A809SGP6_9PROT|nr:TolC family protein [Sulfuriferula nivalis]BBP00110.1 membrane protein [Sulfuriferula nivalis]